MNEHDLLCEILEQTEAFLDTEPIANGAKAKEIETRLRETIHNLREYQAHSFESTLPSAAVKAKLCDRCKTAFFFARDIAFVGREQDEPELRRQGWVPFEMDTVQAKEVIANWRYVIDFNGPYPVVRVEPTKNSGEVWVDHRQTCGTGDGPKHRCAPYLRRYKVNQQRANIEVESWKDDLQALQRKLNRPDGDADT